MRTSKTIGETKYNYCWNGSTLTAQTWGENTLYFRYDGETPIGFEYNDSQYYYVTNLQGDIIAILNDSGECVAEYEYDAWGNCTIISDIDGIAEINPLRYRGYYYDSDTNLYYLQSRYYDANIGRFINSDDVQMLFEDQDTIVQYNLFAYCGNSPVINIDPTGYGKTYVFCYTGSKKHFKDQAKNSPYYNFKKVKYIEVKTSYDFVRQWNKMTGDISNIYLYLHGDPGVLNFYGSDALTFNNTYRSNNKVHFSDMKSVKVKSKVALFSCYGGAGKYGENVAWFLSKKTSCKVLACTGGVSYIKKLGKYYARMSPKKPGNFNWYRYDMAYGKPVNWGAGLIYM